MVLLNHLLFFSASGGGGGDSYGGGSYGGGRSGGDAMGALGANLRNIHWDIGKLPVFEKNFYIEHPAVTRRSDGDAEMWRRSHGITVLGKGVPKPVMTFEEASMPGKSKNIIFKLKLK